MTAKEKLGKVERERERETLSLNYSVTLDTPETKRSLPLPITTAATAVTTENIILLFAGDDVFGYDSIANRQLFIS